MFKNILNWVKKRREEISPLGYTYSGAPDIKATDILKREKAKKIIESAKVVLQIAVPNNTTTQGHIIDLKQASERHIDTLRKLGASEDTIKAAKEVAEKMINEEMQRESIGGFHGGALPIGHTIGEVVENLPKQKEFRMKDKTLCSFKKVGLTFNGVSYTTECGHTLTIVNSKETYLHCPFCGKLRDFIGGV